MYYLLHHPHYESYMIYDHNTRTISQSARTTIFNVICSEMKPCRDMYLGTRIATWGTRTVWYLIVAQWEGAITDLYTYHPELFI